MNTWHICQSAFRSIAFARLAGEVRRLPQTDESRQRVLQIVAIAERFGFEFIARNMTDYLVSGTSFAPWFHLGSIFKAIQEKFPEMLRMAGMPEPDDVLSILNIGALGIFIAGHTDHMNKGQPLLDALHEHLSSDAPQTSPRALFMKGGSTDSSLGPTLSSVERAALLFAEADFLRTTQAPGIPGNGGVLGPARDEMNALVHTGVLLISKGDILDVEQTVDEAGLKPGDVLTLQVRQTTDFGGDSAAVCGAAARCAESPGWPPDICEDFTCDGVLADFDSPVEVEQESPAVEVRQWICRHMGRCKNWRWQQCRPGAAQQGIQDSLTHPHEPFFVHVLPTPNVESNHVRAFYELHCDADYKRLVSEHKEFRARGMWAQEYQPNAMSEFARQLGETEKATLSLRKEVQSLMQRLKGTPDDVLQQKLEYLEGLVCSSQTMNRAMELKHVGIKQEYLDLITFNVVDGATRLSELNEVYCKMTQLLSLFELNIYKVLGTPTNFFATQVAALESWLKRAPFAASAVVVGSGVISGAFVAGIVALLADAGCKCAAWTVLAHVAVGAGIGAVVGAGGALLGLLIYAGYECCYRKKDMKSDTQRVAEMVDVLMTIPDSQYIKQLDSLISDCHTVTEQLPVHDDCLCLYCHAEGQPRSGSCSACCRGHHYMCKECWKLYLRTPRGSEGKCSVCGL
ncbi:unnamed protein product [Symbiodinium natans]|uniref:Uncharacterized protein n=1 Tax=Symbiodinium natans TaxID=878477 RepID=A0A812M7R8_9DINO|nr:unnamed protein product [Symbiodinium natans]